MKYISVFCGSASGNDPVFIQQAKLLGAAIAKRGYGLVYGGAHVGLMGAVADGVLTEGGKVIGVLPDFLKQKELEHKELSELIIVETMHERKAKMSELCDAIISLPGGWGTMEEMFEMLTWGQLALHTKPVALLNLNGFYDSLLAQNEMMISSGFLKEEYRAMLLHDSNVERLLDKVEAYVPPVNDKWFVTK